MFNRRCRKYCYMNNMNFNNHNNSDDCESDMIETSCNNTKCTCQNYSDECECGFDEETLDVFPENPNLAQSYVPYQFMNETFKPCVGLKCGTIFPELVSPYAPLDSMKDIAHIERTNVIREGCNKCQM